MDELSGKNDIPLSSIVCHSGMHVLAQLPQQSSINTDSITVSLE